MAKRKKPVIPSNAIVLEEELAELIMSPETNSVELTSQGIEVLYETFMNDDCPDDVERAGWFDVKAIFKKDSKTYELCGSCCVQVGIHYEEPIIAYEVEEKLITRTEWVRV